VVHDAALALVDELDRILNRDDVVLPGAVGLVDDRRERRGLAASCGSGDQHQAAGQGGELRDHRGQPQLRGSDDLAGDLPEDRGAAELLLKEVGTVTGQSRDLVGEVCIARLLELLNLVLGGDLVEHRLEGIVGENIELDPLHLPPYPERRLLAGDEMEVRCPLVVHQLKEGVYLGHGW
jgi:hypothetical protein